VPFCQHAQIARSAATYSRIHGAGGDQARPNRRSICPLTCEPSPNVKRPPDNCCSDHAVIAVTVGLRGKAIATAVAKRTRVVARAASASAMNGSQLVSAASTPS